MTSISGCTVVRNGVELRYPLEASILSYYALCEEVVLAYDPRSTDGTESFVKDLARRHPKIRLLPSPWDMENRAGGTEIAIQSNVAVESCQGDWVLYVQADEAIHEGDHAAIREALEGNGVLFSRRSFLGTLDREIPAYFAPELLRLVRNGAAYVVGDGMMLQFVQGVDPRVAPRTFRMFNYSRMGDREEILLRARRRDAFYMASEAAIEENQKGEMTQETAPFDPEAHPEAVRKIQISVEPSFPVSMAFLVGPGESQNLVSFLWRLRSWPGEIVAIDDMTRDGGGQVLVQLIRSILGWQESRFRVMRMPLEGDFGRARNVLQELARSPWVLTSAPDEQWDERLLAGLPEIASRMKREGKIIGGFPRANFLDGVLVNDLPSHEWTPEGLRNALQVWPPRNADIQHRLLEKEERWIGKIHEQPARLASAGDRSVMVRDHWILHNKSLDRQRRQDAFYKSLGQKGGMA